MVVVKAPHQESLSRELDPVLMAILANRLDAIVREMTNTLSRTGRSALLNTAKDFSCSIVTADHELLSSADGLQVHVLGSGLQTRSMTELHADLAEGDAFLHNDPYLGNTHTADHTILVPVFVDGEHMFTASAKAHQADCGNALPTTYMPFARDLYEEGGLNFPCVRIQRDYKDVEDVIRMCRRRIRVPHYWYGDYLASLGATRIGEQALKELVAKYGKGTIRTFVREWLDYSERRMIHAIRQLPSGRLESSGCHDPLPGIPDGVPVKVIVNVNAEKGQIEVDLRDNIDCVPAGVNLSESCAISGALIGVMNCIDPTIPRNQGSFRRINVLLRDNRVVGRPKFPASCSMATTNVVNRLINATQCAFSQLGDKYGLAEGAVSMGIGFAVVSGNDWRHKDAPYVNQFIISNNGGPGAPTCDGWVTYAMPDCAASVLIDSVEIIEQKYPVLFRSVKLCADTGGAGRFRGAVAGEVIYGPRHDPMTVAYFAEFNREPPKGARDGLPGSRSFAKKVLEDGSEVDLPPIGMVELPLEPKSVAPGPKLTPIATTFLVCEQHLKSFVARFLPRVHDIEDIVQEVFLRAYDAERERPVHAPKSFLFSIAKNLSLKEIARRARHGQGRGVVSPLTDYPAESDAPEVLSNEASMEDQVDGREKLVAFCRVVATLPPQCRRAFLMRKIYGLSYKEIADELGVTVRTAEKHVAAGLQKSSAYLRRLGHELEDPARAESSERPKEAAGIQ